jgi:predicted dehydrogenase
MKIAVVGLGYWGPNIVRNFLARPEVSEVLCFDQDSARLQKVCKMFPGVRPTATFEEILTSDCDGVAVVVPISLHHPLGMRILSAGKHLLMEKPLAASVQEGEDLVKLAQRNDLVLMVDHTFVYTGAVQKMKEIVARGDIGDIYYFDSVRVNLGLFQHDVNVLWDLAPHDLAIMDYTVPYKPTAVSAVGAIHYNHVEDVAYLTLHFSNSMIAHIHVNWLAPVKIRRILMGGSKRMIVYDDMETIEKVKVYDSGVKVVTPEGIYKTLVEYRTGDMFSPKLDHTEALQFVTQDFVDAIKNRTKPVSDGEAGLRVVRILEAAETSIKRHGLLIGL